MSFRFLEWIFSQKFKANFDKMEFKLFELNLA